MNDDFVDLRTRYRRIRAPYVYTPKKPLTERIVDNLTGKGAVTEGYLANSMNWRVNDKEFQSAMAALAKAGTVVRTVVRSYERSDGKTVVVRMVRLAAVAQR